FLFMIICLLSFINYISNCSTSMTSCSCSPLLFFFVYIPAPSAEFYPLSLHDALPICRTVAYFWNGQRFPPDTFTDADVADLQHRDRKSTRLNSSHVKTSYAVYCLRKKNNHRGSPTRELDALAHAHLHADTPAATNPPQ